MFQWPKICVLLSKIWWQKTLVSIETFIFFVLTRTQFSYDFCFLLEDFENVLSHFYRHVHYRTLKEYCVNQMPFLKSYSLSCLVPLFGSPSTPEILSKTDKMILLYIFTNIKILLLSRSWGKCMLAFPSWICRFCKHQCFVQVLSINHKTENAFNLDALCNEEIRIFPPAIAWTAFLSYLLHKWALLLVNAAQVTVP